MSLQQRVEILRQYENYCYQISFYLVQDEQLSIEAATTTLLELADDSHFLEGSSEERKKQAKQIAIRSSLRVRASV